MVVEFSPLEALEHSLKTWWLVVLLMVLGGGAGWLFHRVQPPIYETAFAWTVNVDYTQTGPITERDVDHIQGSVGGLIHSKLVMEKVIAQAQSQGIEIDLPTLQDISRLERRQSRWKIHVRNSDPEKAAALANLWGQIATDVLTKSHQHAIKARALHDYMSVLKNCAPESEPSTADQKGCALPSIVDFQEQLETVNQQIQQEHRASHGISPAIIFDLPEAASLPTNPVAFGRNLLVFGGALIGFILGILLTNLLANHPVPDNSEK